MSTTRSVAIPAEGNLMRHQEEAQAWWMPYLLQWIAAFVIWPVAALAHNMWGDDTTALPWVTVVLTLAAGVLAFGTWRATAIRPTLQWHATATVVIGALWLLAATIADPGSRPVLDLWLIGAPVAALSWNFRRLIGRDQRQRNSGGTDSLTKAVKAIKSAKVLEEAPNKIVAELEAATGSSADDIVSGRGKMAASLEVGANRVRINPNPDDHSKVKATIVPRDMLKKPTPWPGPTAAGGCITEPITVGVYEDGVPAQLWLPGDPATGRNATHMIVMGMSGSGKTHGAKEIWTELLTRRNCDMWLADPAKGMQSIGFVAPHASWAEPTLDGSTALVDQLMTVVTARTNQLADEGLDQWTPESSLNYQVVWIEEAPRAVRDSDELIDVAQTARSAGMSLVLSLQRADMDNIPVQVRQQFGAVWCFGVKNIKDAMFVLSEEIVELGADPSKWANKKPGYSYLDAPGIDEERVLTPLRTFDRADDVMLEWVQAGGEWRPGTDPVTAKAGGRAYANRKRFVVDDRGRVVEASTQSSSTPSTPAIPDAEVADNPDADLQLVDEDQNSEGNDVDEDQDAAALPLQPFRGRLSAEDDKNAPPLPDDLEPDLPAVDPDEPLPEIDEDDEVQMRPVRPTPREARKELRVRLAALYEAGAQTVGPKDIKDFEEIRSRPWVSAEMSRLAAIGELVETTKPGVYRFSSRGLTAA